MLLGLNAVILLVSSELGGNGYVLDMLTSNLKKCKSQPSRLSMVSVS